MLPLGPPRCAAFLGVLVLVGCLGAPGPGGPPGGPGTPPTLPGGWRQDCSISAWADPCTALATVDHGPANEVMLAIAPSNPDNVVIGAKDYTPEGSDCVWAGTSVTHDGGRNWTNGWVGGNKADRDPRVAAFDCVTDPVLEFGPDGTLYYVVEAYSILDDEAGMLPPLPLPGPFGSVMWLAASADGGDTWEFRGAFSSSPGGPLFHDKSDMAVSPTTGTIVASWTMFSAPSSQLLYTRSDDGGMTWSPHVPLMHAEGLVGATAMIDLEWDAEGILHAVWFDWATGDVLYAVSSDDGRTFSAPRVIAAAQPWTGANAPNGQWRIFDSTMMAVDLTGGERGGWMYLTWADDGAEAGIHHVWVMRSEDGGTTWTERATVGSVPASDQLHPNVAVAGDGSLHLFFYDRHYEPGNTLIDVTHALSLDGGTNWTFSRVTASGFDGDKGIHQSGVPFIGDYNGIASVGDVVYLTYADTRTGESEVAVAKFVRQ